MGDFGRDVGTWWGGMPLGGKLAVGVFAAGSFSGIMYLLLGSFASALVLLAIVGAAIVVLQLIKWWIRRAEQAQSRRVQAALLERMSGASGAGLDESQEEQDVRLRLEQRWRNVHATLKERSYDYYSFPWYLIIGPAQSGKTTTIQKSSQEFPIGQKPVVDYGGTRGCNWFFTNKAILIDTAGRYVEHLAGGTEDMESMLAKDQEEWTTFLDLLREMRSRSPINGVILTIKVEDLVDPEPARRHGLVEKLRKALLDIEGHLKIQVPVYVLVTMCDKLIGFVDFFAHLPGLADRTLFGWSRPGPFDQPFDAAGELPPAFAQMHDRLDRLRIEFMEREAGRSAGTVEDLQRMDRLSTFPEEFATLGEPLTQVLSQVFATSAYNEPHFLRGVYFTSGVQEGRPVLSACRDLVPDAVEEDIAAIAGEQKAFFIADLYEEKIFKEQGLARMTRRAYADQRRKRIAYYGFAAVVGLAMTLWVALKTIRLWNLPRKPLVTLQEAIKAPARGFTRGGQRELLDSMQGLSRSTAELEAEAGLIGGAQVTETVDKVKDCQAKLLAEKCFTPTIEDFLEHAERTKVDSPEEAASLAGALQLLFRFGLLRGRKTDEEEEPLSSVAALLLQIGPVHNKLRLAAGQEMRAYLGMVALAEQCDAACKGRSYLRDLVLERAGHEKQLTRIQRILDTACLRYWGEYTAAVGSDVPSTQVPDRTRDPDRFQAWWWSRLSQFDRSIVAELAKLRDVLDELPKVRSVRQYRDKVQDPWDRHRRDLDKTLHELEQFDRDYPGTPALATSLEEQKAKFDKLKTVIMDIVGRRRTDQSQALEKKLDEIDGTFADRKQQLAEWNKISRNLVQWREGQTWVQLKPYDRLIRYVERTPDKQLDDRTLRSLADGERERFGKVRERLIEDYRLPDEGPQGPAPLVNLLTAASQRRQVMEDRIVAVFFGDLVDRIEEKGSSLIESLAGVEPHSGSAAHTVSAIAVALLEEYRRQKRNDALWHEVRDARPKIVDLVRRYFRDTFLRFWTIDVVAEYPASDADVFARAVGGPNIQPLHEWYKNFRGLGLLVVRIGETRRQHDSARSFADLWDHLGPDGSELRKEVAPVLTLWQRYEQDHGQQVNAAAEALSAALDRLNRSADYQEMLKVAEEADRAGTWSQTKRLKDLSAGSPDPFVAVLDRYAAPVPLAVLRGHPRLAAKVWAGLLERARPLRGRFPFVRVRPGDRERTLPRATWNLTLGFLKSAELAKAETMMDHYTEAQKQFITRCEALKKLLLMGEAGKSIELTLTPRGNNPTNLVRWTLAVDLGRGPTRTLFLHPSDKPLTIRWTPGSSPVSIACVARGDGPQDDWKQLPPFSADKADWTNFLAFFYAYVDRAEAGARSLIIPFELQGAAAGRKSTMTLQVRTEPRLPSVLPDVAMAESLSR